MGLIKVKLKTLSAGPKGVFPAGSVVPMDEEVARQLVASKLAEYAEPPVRAEDASHVVERMRRRR